MSFPALAEEAEAFDGDDDEAAAAANDEHHDGYHGAAASVGYDETFGGAAAAVNYEADGGYGGAGTGLDDDDDDDRNWHRAKKGARPPLSTRLTPLLPQRLPSQSHGPPQSSARPPSGQGARGYTPLLGGPTQITARPASGLGARGGPGSRGPYNKAGKPEPEATASSPVSGVKRQERPFAPQAAVPAASMYRREQHQVGASTVVSISSDDDALARPPAAGGFDFDQDAFDDLPAETAPPSLQGHLRPQGPSGTAVDERRSSARKHDKGVREQQEIMQGLTT